MKVLVCGGRHYLNVPELDQALTGLHKKKGITLLIEGGAKGADMLARLWAQRNQVEVMSVNAEWEKWGYAAGPIRNKRMLDEGKPDGVVAFPGGRGTLNMIKLAEEAGIKVWRAGDWPND